MAKTGPKSKYKEDLHPQLIKWMLRSGLTVEQIGQQPEIGVTKKTIYEWAKKYQAIGDALKGEGKRFIDYLVEDSLLKRALGYEYTEEETTVTYNAKGEERPVRVRRTRKMIHPDTQAAIRWLMNRKPDEWRDAKPGLTDAESVDALKAIARAYQEDQTR